MQHTCGILCGLKCMINKYCSLIITIIYNLLLSFIRTISLILDDLNNISKDMSDELDIQNNLIADMIKQSSKTDRELQTVNRLSKNLI